MKFEISDGIVTSGYSCSFGELVKGVATIASVIYAGLGDDEREMFRQAIIAVLTEYPGTWDVSSIEAQARAATEVTTVTKAGPLS